MTFKRFLIKEFQFVQTVNYKTFWEKDYIRIRYKEFHLDNVLQLFLKDLIS